MKTDTAEKQVPLRKFRVLVGTHIENKRAYTKGKIVKTTRDLCKLFVGKFVEVGKREDNDGDPEADKATTAKVK